MKKVGVFLGDYFWSSIPYDGLPLYNLLSEHYDTDLIMFDKDIRLNKQFKGIWANRVEKFYFDSKHFKNCNLRTVSNWQDLYKVSADYDLILTSAHIAPKTRLPVQIPPASDWRYRKKTKKTKIAQCPVAVWDIGGADILTTARIFSDFLLVKGPIWKEWLVKMGEDEDKIFVTGTPHYDSYLDEFAPHLPEPILNEQEFSAKYRLRPSSTKILIMPCNPSSHRKYFEENLEQLKKLYALAENHDIEFLIKTYPHDYVFYEISQMSAGPEYAYSGIYKRPYTHDVPQYTFLQEQFPKAKVIDSQDHFSAMKYCDKLFNIAGSHIAWESYFTDITSCSINYEHQPYYKSVSFLPEWLKYPDDLLNCNLQNVENMLEYTETEKSKCSRYFTRGISIFNILNSVEHILRSK